MFCYNKKIIFLYESTGYFGISNHFFPDDDDERNISSVNICDPSHVKSLDYVSYYLITFRMYIILPKLPEKLGQN